MTLIVCLLKTHLFSLKQKLKSLGPLGPLGPLPHPAPAFTGNEIVKYKDDRNPLYLNCVSYTKWPWSRLIIIAPWSLYRFPCKVWISAQSFKGFCSSISVRFRKKGVKRLTWQKEDLSKDRLLLSAPDMLIRRRCLENIHIYWQLWKKSFKNLMVFG